MIKYIIADTSEVIFSAIKSLILKLEPKAGIFQCNTLESDLFSLLTSEQPDIIFLNIELPNHSGTEICKRLKSNPSGAEIPVILYGTQSASQYLTNAVIESGADAFFTYPFDELSFSLQLRNLLKLNSTYLHETTIPEFPESHELNQRKNTNKDFNGLKKVEAELLESEKVYKNLVERLPDGVYKSTHEGKFIEINEAMVKMLGYDSKEELLAIDIKNELYFQPEERESIVLQEKYEEMGIFRLKKKDGSGIWVEDHGWYLLDTNGEILFHEGILRDITERKKAEEELRESEERFKMLYEKGASRIPISRR